MAISGAMMTEAGLSFLGLGEFGEELGKCSSLCLFPKQHHEKSSTGGMCRPSSASVSVCLGFMLIGYYGKIKKGGE